MGHEYDCDKPPNEVLPCVFGQAGHLVQANRQVADVGFYVALVAPQVKACSRLPWRGLVRPDGQPIERVEKARDSVKVSRHGVQVWRPALSQHLPNTIPQFPLPLPALRHLLTEVLGIKGKPVEQEPRGYVGATSRASVSPHAQLEPAAACTAVLKSDGGVELIPTCLASAPSFPLHRQVAVTPRAFAAHEHDSVVELPGTASEACDGFRKPECQAYDVDH